MRSDHFSFSSYAGLSAGDMRSLSMYTFPVYLIISLIHLFCSFGYHTRMAALSLLNIASLPQIFLFS